MAHSTRTNPPSGDGGYIVFCHVGVNAIVEDVQYIAEDRLLLVGTYGRGVWKLCEADAFLPFANALKINGDEVS